MGAMKGEGGSVKACHEEGFHERGFHEIGCHEIGGSMEEFCERGAVP